MTKEIANRIKPAEALIHYLAIRNVSYTLIDLCDSAVGLTRDLDVHMDLDKQLHIAGNLAGNNSTKIVDCLGISGTAKNLASVIGGLNTALKIEREILRLQNFLEKKHPEYFHGLSDEAKSRIKNLESQIRFLHSKYLEEVLDPNIRSSNES